MKLATCTLKSISPYSQSRNHLQDVEKKADESHDEFDTRTWRHKCHATKDGHIFIPPMAFKMGLDRAAQMFSKKIAGKGNATYSKFFVSGVLCMDGPELPLKPEDVAGDRIFANADGKRGSGKRVWRTFPRIDEWEADVDFHILSEDIPKDIFEDYLRKAGAFVGIGRFRPENGGFYGRFEVADIKWN